jgi:hypothetical protein
MKVNDFNLPEKFADAGIERQSRWAPARGELRTSPPRISEQSASSSSRPHRFHFCSLIHSISERAAFLMGDAVDYPS